MRTRMMGGVCRVKVDEVGGWGMRLVVSYAFLPSTSLQPWDCLGSWCRLGKLEAM